MKIKKNLTKKKRLFIAISVISIIGLFTSCSPEYIPNMVNTPIFSNQGEFQATVATGTSNFDAQLGYAITDNIAIIANGSYADETNDTTEDYHKHLMLEGGLGYYKKISESGRIEVFGGYGISQIKTLVDNGSFGIDYVDVNYNRIFLQPGVGAVTDIFEGSFATRVAFVQMIPAPEVTNISESWHVFLEPVMTVKVGYRYAKAVIQVGYSFPINEENIDYNTQGLIFNFGLNINIGRHYTNL